MEQHHPTQQQVNGYSACVTLIFFCVGFVFLFPLNAWIPLDRRLAGLFGAILCGLVHFMFPGVGASSIGQYIDVDVLLILIAIMAVNFMVMRQPVLLKGIRVVQDLIIQNPSRGIWAVAGVAFLASPFITNDGLCLLLTGPVLYAFHTQRLQKKLDSPASRSSNNTNSVVASSHANVTSPSGATTNLVTHSLEEIDKFYFCLVIACSANIGSAMTYTGNPQNIIIAGHLGKYMSGGMFFGLLILPATICCLISTWYLDRCRKYERSVELHNAETTSTSFSAGPVLDFINRYIPILKIFGYAEVVSTEAGDHHDDGVDDIESRRGGQSPSLRTPTRSLTKSPGPSDLGGLGMTSPSVSSKSQTFEEVDLNPIVERSVSSVTFDLKGESPQDVETKNYDGDVNSNNRGTGGNDSNIRSKSPDALVTSPVSQASSGNAVSVDSVDAEMIHEEKVLEVASLPYFVFTVFAVLIIFELTGVFSLVNIFVYIAVLMVVCTLLLNYYLPIIRHLDFDTSHKAKRNLIMEYTEAMFNDLDYNLIIIFIGLFIVSGSFVNTGVPNIVWGAVAGSNGMAFKTGVSITLISTYIIVFSQLVGNVPLVYMAANEMDKLPVDTQKFGWVMLAWVSTVAGNFTLCGSAANIIVAEKASRHRNGRVHIGAVAHFKVCGLMTLVCILIGVLIICVEFM
jgi:Na+/H+ antiporter NhaD/arsenite permease-like protein